MTVPTSTLSMIAVSNESTVILSFSCAIVKSQPMEYLNSDMLMFSFNSWVQRRHLQSIIYRDQSPRTHFTRTNRMLMLCTNSANTFASFSMEKQPRHYASWSCAHTCGCMWLGVGFGASDLFQGSLYAQPYDLYCKVFTQRPTGIRFESETKIGKATTGYHSEN